MIPAIQNEELSQLRRMRAVSLLEGTTLLLLLGVAVPLKHLAGMPVATSIMGPIHGIAFVLYVWMLIQTVSGGGWTRTAAARMVLAAFIPFGAFVNERALARRQASLAKPV
jgi:integral membrane protein